MNRLFLALSLLISIASCQNKKKNTVSDLYGFSIDYIHSGEGGNTQALDQFTKKLTGINWNTFQKIKIHSELEKKEIEIIRIKKEQQYFKIITKNVHEKSEIEISDLTKEVLQRIIDEWEDL